MVTVTASADVGRLALFTVSDFRDLTSNFRVGKLMKLANSECLLVLVELLSLVCVGSVGEPEISRKVMCMVRNK